MDDDPADEDVDFEVQLEVVDVGSFALTVVSLASNALASDSMPVATSLGNVVYGRTSKFKMHTLLFDRKGVNVVSSKSTAGKKDPTWIRNSTTVGHQQFIVYI